jgi:hypothetical protein
MSYTTGGSIQATDYNTFATLSNAVNEVFADQHPGATTIAGGANYGYGQTPALIPVSTGDDVHAAEWADLFSAMRDCATHQGSTVVPPVPASDPVAGSTIIALNTPSLMSAAVTTLRTNRMNLAVGQTSLIPNSTTNPSAWTTSLSQTFQTNFGSWNNARYYFNTGSAISVVGAQSGSTPDEIAWQAFFSANFPVNINWTTTTPTAGGNDVGSPAGFYGLTTTYQLLYKRFVGNGSGPYYTTNYVAIGAKLANTAGTNGLVDFQIWLVDGDTLPVTKSASSTTLAFNRIQSSGVIAYPGSYAATSGTPVSDASPPAWATA